MLYATLASVPNIKDKPSFLEIEDADKIVHFGIFLVFTYFFHLAYKLPIVWIWAIGIIWGILIEILQEKMGLGRSFDWFDWFFDILGVFSGTFLFLQWNNNKSRLRA